MEMQMIIDDGGDDDDFDDNGNDVDDHDEDDGGGDVVDDDDDDDGGYIGIHDWLLNCRGLQIHAACWVFIAICVCVVLMDVGMYNKLLGGQFFFLSRCCFNRSLEEFLGNYKCCFVEPDAAGQNNYLQFPITKVLPSSCGGNHSGNCGCGTKWKCRMLPWIYCVVWQVLKSYAYVVSQYSIIDGIQNNTSHFSLLTDLYGLLGAQL